MGPPDALFHGRSNRSSHALYHKPGSGPHDEYRLKEADEDLLPVFLSLMQWEDKYLHEGRAPLSFIETDTGRATRVRVTVEPVPETTSGNIDIQLNPASWHS
jgi:hypothetical protein